MKRSSAAVTALASISLMAVLAAQGDVVLGDHSTPLKPASNVGVNNATMRDQAEVRVLRVVVDPGATRVLHSHDDVKFQLFIPISAQMQFDLEGSKSVTVPPWQPYFIKGGTQHGFHNDSAVPVEIMEVFVK